jgi:hypothetical protein
VARAGIGGEVVGDDLKMLMSVLSHHPHWALKQGAGVAAVRVVRYDHAYGSNRGLALERVDGSLIDISWVTCFDGIRQDRDAKQAARYEIAEQRQAAINTGVCAICGRALAGPLQIDHAPPWPFEAILTEFMTLNGLDWEAIRVVSRDGLHSQFEDRDLAGRWQGFHASLARLRVVHKRCNLSRSGGR